MSLVAGTKLGRYEVVGPLGEVLMNVYPCKAIRGWRETWYLGIGEL
jgi:hypothetical protein